MGMSSEQMPKLSSSTQGILETLDSAEKLFWGNLNLIARRGSVADVREAAVSLALIQAFQTSLGQPDIGKPALVVGLLGK